MDEFSLIQKYFTFPPSSKNTLLSVGDDCALIKSDRALALSTDTLIENVHFFAGMDPRFLAHKALAVNLSDLAAVGAKPLAFLLALTLPAANEDWLSAFSQSLKKTADLYQLDLIGGNTARGPLSMTLTIIGELDPQKALKRNTAQAGDDIYVTGVLGAAALGLKSLQKKIDLPENVKAQALEHFYRPTPRVAFAQTLGGLAHAAIDISDGFLQDLNHILIASKVGAKLWKHQLPIFSENLDLALNGGEDYELCFTAAPEAKEAIMAQAQKLGLPLSIVGMITPSHSLELLNEQGQALPLNIKGYQHF